MPGSHNRLLGQKCFRGTNVRNQHLERTHYVAYNALCVIYYHDTISCMYQHIQAKMHQICVFSEQTAIIRPQKSGILILIG